MGLAGREGSCGGRGVRGCGKRRILRCNPGSAAVRRRPGQRGGLTAVPRLRAQTASMKVPTLERLTGPLERWFDAAEAHGRAKAWPS